MLKFKFLLWVMTKLMQRAIKTNTACAKYVAGKRLEFQIQTLDRIGRYFRVQDGTVKSFAGLSPAPQFTMTSCGSWPHDSALPIWSSCCRPCPMPTRCRKCSAPTSC